MTHNSTPYEDYKPLLPLQQPRRPPILPLWLGQAVGIFAACVMLAAIVAYGQGVIHEYNRVTMALAAAEQRAEAAEAQLATIIRTGDLGVLVARIGKDLDGYELRLVPGGIKK